MAYSGYCVELRPPPRPGLRLAIRQSEGLAGITVGRIILRKALLEIQRREYARALSAHRIQGPRINTQGLEDGRRHLGCTHLRFYRLAVEIRMGEQHYDIGVVMGKTTV